MNHWTKLSTEEIKNKVFNCLSKNVNYYDSNILGVPASHLDKQVFYQDVPFLSNAPYLSTLIHNPNHIGCHTLDQSESFFKGTQEIERELIDICAEDILHGKANDHDGYVASGGTEANMQAIWIYRNFFLAEHNAKHDEICILCSEDSHYSMSKAANVFNIKIAFVPVDHDRQITEEAVSDTIKNQQSSGAKYFVVVANMMTTMFGSADKVDTYAKVLEDLNCNYKLHVDGAYGGFFYPFSSPDTDLHLGNPYVTSVTLDAHKMLQAPYGTGIFLIKKGFMKYANTKEASYIEGEDSTLIGSRSGANAVAVWMILMTYGPYGWSEKILILLNRTQWLCNELSKKNIKFYRETYSNIVTIDASSIDAKKAEKFGLVPDNHHNPKWFKIVIMEHVTIDKLKAFVVTL